MSLALRLPRFLQVIPARNRPARTWNCVRGYGKVEWSSRNSPAASTRGSTGGGPLHATDLIVLRIYQMAWEFLQFGGASALSLVLFVLLLTATWIQFRLLGRRVEYA